MNRFFEQLLVSILIFTHFINAQEVPTLKELCVKKGINWSDEILKQLPDDCLIPILVEKIKLKLFPVDINPKGILIDPEDRIHSVAISADGTKGISGSYYGAVRLWNLIDMIKIDTLKAETDNRLHSIAMKPDGRIGLSGSGNGIIEIWDLVNHKEIIPPLSSPGNSVLSVAITSNGERVVAGYGDGSIKVWNLIDRKKINELSGRISNAISSIAINSNATLAISGSYVGIVQIWDLVNNKVKILFRKTGSPIFSVAMIPNGTQAISGGVDGINIFNSRKKTRTTIPFEDVLSVAITDDGRMGIFGFRNGEAIVWDLVNNKKIAHLIGHNTAVQSVTVTPDGSKALSGSDDKTIKVWDLRPLLIDRLLFDWIKEIYNKLYQGHGEPKQKVYDWIVNKYKELDQAESLERAKKLEQERLKQELLEKSTKEGLQRTRRGTLEETEHQEKRPKKDE